MKGITSVHACLAQKRFHSLISERINSHVFLWLLATLAGTRIVADFSLLAQTPVALPPAWAAVSSPPTLQAKVQEVPLVLSVTDHKGKYVDKLTTSDLTILDNDQEQRAVTFFEHETNLPLNVAIIIDVSASVAERFSTEQGTIKSFIHTIARRSDSVNVFAFNDKVRLISRVDNNWKAVSRSIKKLKPKGNTALYDAVVDGAHFLGDHDKPSRRIIIVITDGEENNSANTLDRSITAALRAESVVYAVNVSSDIAWDSDARHGEWLLKRLADATGGAYFRSGQDGDLAGAFAKIRRDLRSQYFLAYKPSNLGGSVFHRIQIIAHRKLQVRCRSGYFVR
jgi:Ca-activated chloride channel family protein